MSGMVGAQGSITGRGVPGFRLWFSESKDLEPVCRCAHNLSACFFLGSAGADHWSVFGGEGKEKNFRFEFDEPLVNSRSFVQS